MKGPGRTPKGSARRDQILDVAIEQLVAHGPAEFSLRAVASAAGIRLGNLQYYFATRGELVGAVLDRKLNHELARVEALLGAPTIDDPPDEARLMAIIDLILADQSDRQTVVLFQDLWALAARDPEISAVVRAFYARYQDQVTAVIMLLRPGLNPAVATRSARLTLSLIEGASLFRSGTIGEPGDVEFDQLLKITVLRLLTGEHG